VQISRATTDITALPDRTTRVLFCVPDDELAHAAQALARAPHRQIQQHDTPWIAAHVSGAHPAQTLAPLRACGAILLSIHPLQTFTAATPPGAFSGIQMTIEGDDDAQAYGDALARLLGAIPQHITSNAKPLYHLSAVLASNGLVALLATARHVWQAAGLPRDDAFKALAPLVDTTWANVQRNGSAALTGPAARGDAATIAAHLRALKRVCSSGSAPALLRDNAAETLYTALTDTMLRIQHAQDALSEDDARRVRKHMREHMQSAEEAAPPDPAPPSQEDNTPAA
jgi:predicted short-subunit dehydrogenase-like oxidoreductase (DUF2520 family)